MDQDGRKEFVLWEGGAVRVVSYSAGGFRFRTTRDELIGVQAGGGLVDLSGDGHAELIRESPFPEDLNGKTIEIPHVMRWSTEAGFVDASSQFTSYYADRIVPELRIALANEKDEKLRHVYEGAIAYIQSTLSPDSAHKLGKTGNSR